MATKSKRLGIKLSETRFNKLKEYAQQKDVTMTQIIESYIDRISLDKTKKAD
ncbi:hypothetical protein Cyast_0833 [Cyanobacterium stanieri PCC 7202]|uniref:CopG domain protein DNA-binding domain protein n=1 Tax=Cyanobacterium stanieri (strain ATCC 29140 / PCC 7202) TaxID=292563 RepID=K9YK86_CYASC|nr:hypothetical protein Cyast_0833 [Cyanobacterium stanieri PCC 7202]